MRSRPVLRLCLTLAVILVLAPSCSDSPSGPGTPPGVMDWQLLSTGNAFNAVWAFSPDDIWAPASGKFHHYDGDAWRIKELPDELRPAVHDAWFRTPDDGFLVGHQGKAVRYRHGRLEEMPTPTDMSLYGVWGFGSGQAYAVGSGGEVIYYDGNVWKREETPSDMLLLDVWATGLGTAFAVGSGGTIIHRENGEWRTMESGTIQTLRGVWGSSGQNVYAVGQAGTLLHYDGKEWSYARSGTGNALHAIFGRAPNDIVVAGEYVTLRYDGAAWSVDEDDSYIQHLFYGDWSGLVGAGREGQVMRYHGTDAEVLLSGHARDQSASWGNTQSLFIAAGYDIRRLEDGDWTDWNAVFPGILSDVWGTASDDVFAAGSSQLILHFDGSGWNQMHTGAEQPIFRGIWGTSNTNVYFAGSEQFGGLSGSIYHYDGDGFTRIHNFIHPYWDVWGVSETDAIAVGDRGHIAHFDGSEWRPMDSGTIDLLQCVWGDAPDNYYAASREGRVYMYDGTSWKPLDLQARTSVYDLWGDAGQVYAAATQEGVYQIDGTQWKVLDVPDYGTYLSVWSQPDVGMYLTGRFGLVLYSDKY